MERDSEKLDKIIELLENIEKRLDKIEQDTEKNAEVASTFERYKPTIDKVENGLKKLLNFRLWPQYQLIDE